MTARWSPADTAPEGVAILTKIEDKWGQRNVQKLIRAGEDWFRPGGRGKVYYQPTHWQERPTPSSRPRAPRKSTASLAKLRKELVAVQRSRCGICGTAMADYDPRPGAPFQASLEHVVPRKLGGGLSGNVFASHNRCNGLKADRRPTGCELIFLAMVNARRGGTTL